MVAQEIMKWVKEWVAGWSSRQFFSRSSHQLTSRGAASSGYPLVLDSTGKIDASFIDDADIDHGSIGGLADDDHTQYALLAGRAAGQTLNGGNAANDDITIHGTSHATRTSSYVLLQPTAGNVGIQTTTPATTFDTRGNSAWFAGTLSGGLASGAGTGIRISTGNIFAYNYAASAPTTLTLQALLGATIIGGALTVNGATDLDTTLNVDGATVLQTTLNVKGAVDLDTTLNVDGVATFQSGIVLGNETLTVYDEGTWTPALAFGGGTTGITYTVQVGRYTRIGNLVTLWMRIALSSKGSSTGSATITGLPLTSSNITSLIYPASIRASTTTHTDALQAFVNSNATAITLEQNAAGTSSVLTDTNFGNTTTLGITISYRTG